MFIYYLILTLQFIFIVFFIGSILGIGILSLVEKIKGSKDHFWGGAGLLAGYLVTAIGTGYLLYFDIQSEISNNQYIEFRDFSENSKDSNVIQLIKGASADGKITRIEFEKVRTAYVKSVKENERRKLAEEATRIKREL